MRILCCDDKTHSLHSKLNGLTICDRVAKFTVLLSEPDLLVAEKATLFDNFPISFCISATTQKFGAFLYKIVNRISSVGLYKSWLCTALAYFDGLILVAKISGVIFLKFQRCMSWSEVSAQYFDQFIFDFGNDNTE